MIDDEGFYYISDYIERGDSMNYSDVYNGIVYPDRAFVSKKEFNDTLYAFSQAKSELAMLRKAYEELAEANSKKEEENDRLRKEISKYAYEITKSRLDFAEQSVVLTFLWDKLVPTK